MKIRTSLMALALVMGLASASQAADLVRKVDSFDLVADQSGSMMMKMEGTKMTKAAGAKQVLTSIVEALPDLGYKGSAHTVAPAAGVTAYALMAAGGDMGASVAPQLLGIVVDGVSGTDFAADLGITLGISAEQVGLKAGMLVIAVFPILGIAVLGATMRYFKKNKQS